MAKFEKGHKLGFKKGQSGNPGGRPKLTPDDHDAMAVLQGGKVAAAKVLVAAVNGRRVSPIALAAARDVLDRTEGRAIQRIMAEAQHSFVALLPAVVEDAGQWERRVQASLASQAPPVIEATAEPVKPVELTSDERRALQRITPAPAKPDGTRFYDDREAEPVRPDSKRRN